MPWSKCPLCGTMSHLNVGDVKDWYEEYHPELTFGSLIPTRCFFCWQEVKAGDAVVIRKPTETNQAIQPGERGVMLAILSEKDESLYLVKLASGKECYFIRAEFRKLRDSEK